MDLQAVTNELSLRLNRIALEKISIKPATPVLVIEDITHEEVIAWLDSLHSQMWSQFIIIDEKDKKKAADWFLKSLYQFYEFRASNNQN